MLKSATLADGGLRWARLSSPPPRVVASCAAPPPCCLDALVPSCFLSSFLLWFGDGVDGGGSGVIGVACGWLCWGSALWVASAGKNERCGAL